MKIIIKYNIHEWEEVDKIKKKIEVITDFKIDVITQESKCD